MPRLILINGLPGSGKSTLARRYVAAHPLSLYLDIDEVRDLLGAWKDDIPTAFVLGRKLAVAMARVALADGRDVVVPQFLGRTDFVLVLEGIAAEAGATFVEIMIEIDPESAKERLSARAAGPMSRSQRDAHELLDQSGGLDAVPEMHRRLQEVRRGRPATRIVEPVPHDVDLTYERLARLCET